MYDLKQVLELNLVRQPYACAYAEMVILQKPITPTSRYSAVSIKQSLAAGSIKALELVLHSNT